LAWAAAEDTLLNVQKLLLITVLDPHSEEMNPLRTGGDRPIR
jgi:hypothetical protein